MLILPLSLPLRLGMGDEDVDDGVEETRSRHASVCSGAYWEGYGSNVDDSYLSDIYELRKGDDVVEFEDQFE